MSDIRSETEFEVIAVNDGTRDYFLRLSRLVPELNVVQLKSREIDLGSRRIIHLGIQTDAISLPSFMGRVNDLNLTIELKPVVE